MSYVRASVDARKQAASAGERFYLSGVPCKYGHNAKRYLANGQCVDCKRLGVNNPGRCASAKRRYGENTAYVLLSSAKARAKRLGVPFDIAPEELVIPEFCPVLGLRLKKGSGPRQWNSPSVDRIVPELGYVESNVRVISWRANWLKSSGSKEELAAIVRYLEEP